MTFKIVIAQPVHSAVLSLLEGHGEVVMNPGPEPFSRDELIGECQDAEALMAFMTERIDEPFLDQCKKLKIVAGALKGYNNIDVAACSRRGIAVTNVPDLLSEPTAELAVGLMIAIARNFGPGDRYLRSGEFKGWRPRFYGGSLVGATVAVIGAGGVGRVILRMLGGFDCKRVYVDKTALPTDLETRLGCRHSDLETALADADFVVLGLHLMPGTLHFVDHSFLNAMKPGSYLINPARGSLVDEAAVVKALNEGHLGGYAADTFEMEDWAREERPKAVPEGLLNSERTVLTPHIGSAVRSVGEAIEMSAAESIIEIADGRFPASAVNPEALRTR
jgi:phosphonate dehydrogenase